MWEAIELVNQLFSASLKGRDTKFSGEFFKMETTRLWTMPDQAPPILVATAGPINAKKTGKFAQGMITVGAADEKIKLLWMACDDGCREAGKEAVPKLLQIHVSWARTQEQALENAMKEWPNGGMPFPKQDIKNPEDFAAMAKLVRPDDFRNRVLISADLQEHTEHIQRYVDMGFDEIHLHNVGRVQAEFIEVFGREVLPNLRLGGREDATPMAPEPAPAG
jgi:alkanesulfonate monooxygenase SsuD/methylene tetrahydromethanopterin reductase-like flavin-dependent oxidoreductase (luciferase family)